MNRLNLPKITKPSILAPLPWLQVRTFRMSSIQDDIFKLITQIKVIATSLQADQAEIDNLHSIEAMVQNGSLSEEELQEIRDALIQTVKELLVLQKQLIQEIQATGDELARLAEFVAAYQEEQENINRISRES